MAPKVEKVRVEMAGGLEERWGERVPDGLAAVFFVQLCGKKKNDYTSLQAN